MCCVYLTAQDSTLLHLAVGVDKYASSHHISSFAQVHCLLTGDMHIIALVHCRLIPIGEEDWLRRDEDGVRELQQALQLEDEVRIRIHKVSSPLLARQYLACGHIILSWIPQGYRPMQQAASSSSASATVHTLWHMHHGCVCVLRV